MGPKMTRMAFPPDYIYPVTEEYQKWACRDREVYGRFRGRFEIVHFMKRRMRKDYAPKPLGLTKVFSFMGEGPTARRYRHDAINQIEYLFAKWVFFAGASFVFGVWRRIRYYKRRRWIGKIRVQQPGYSQVRRKYWFTPWELFPQSKNMYILRFFFASVILYTFITWLREKEERINYMFIAAAATMWSSRRRKRYRGRVARWRWGMRFMRHFKPRILPKRWKQRKLWFFLFVIFSYVHPRQKRPRGDNFPPFGFAPYGPLTAVQWIEAFQVSRLLHGGVGGVVPPLPPPPYKCPPYYQRLYGPYGENPVEYNLLPPIASQVPLSTRLQRTQPLQRVKTLADEYPFPFGERRLYDDKLDFARPRPHH